jgi:hypothetical protein
LKGCDVHNDRSVLAELERIWIIEELGNALRTAGLRLSPDIWTDNFRQVTHLEATAHYVDDDDRLHSIDLFCVKFKGKTKSGGEI